METEGKRIKSAKKIFSPTRETPKKKKQSRKESESKIAVPQNNENTELKTQEKETKNKAEIAQYVLKLKHQLDITKKQLKSEETKFNNVIQSIFTHFGAQDEDFAHAMNWTHTQQTEHNQEINKGSGFEKLFTTHKYQLQEKKMEIIPELTQEKPKSRKNKDASGLIKINLKELDTKMPDFSKESSAVEKEEKPSKKKKNPPTNGEEGEGQVKKKRVKKNKEEVNQTSHRKDTEDNKIILSPIHLSDKESSIDFDKIKKAEEAIHKYEDFAHGGQGVHPYDMNIPNNLFHDGMKFRAQQGINDPHLLNPQLFGENVGAMLGGLDMASQNKLVEDLIKMGMQDPLLRSMAPPQDMMNYYQRNYKS